ncbi:hypothetical protein ECANGB1_1507 [Enterospora canceri]|uniref:Uncharacterized protein n=1 Tax=Enterospora canceri TaxID=1081671 RepID=A0A1Y1S5W2_9MICR|nr:hypothetical protein ECANGB1_1507 [Enterospora canceri]
MILFISRLYAQITLIDDLGLNQQQLSSMEKVMKEKLHDNVKILPKPSSLPMATQGNPNTTPPTPSSSILPMIKLPERPPGQESKFMPTPENSNFKSNEQGSVFHFNKPRNSSRKPATKHKPDEKKKNKKKPKKKEESSSNSSSSEMKPPSWKTKKLGSNPKFQVPSKNAKRNVINQAREKANFLKDIFAKEHNEKARDAEVARANYLNVKLHESLFQNKELSGDLRRLKKAERDLEQKSTKYHTIMENVDMIISKLNNEKDMVDQNGEGNGDTINDIRSKIRMTQNEIADLYKKLNRQKDALQNYFDQVEMLTKRTSGYSERELEIENKKEANMKKYQEFEKMANRTEKNLAAIRNKIRELEEDLKKEKNRQTQLEIQKSAPEDDKHLPLFLNAF